MILLGGLWTAGAALAGPPSLLGGRQMPVGFSHQVGVGWPGAFYEYWHSGTPDWGIGGEIVYGDWSGEFSDVEIGGAVNVPLRWHLGKVGGAAEVGLQVKPGMLMGSMEAGREDLFVFGIRNEVSVPVTVDLTPKVNLITGATVPLSYLVIDGAKDPLVLPILARLGAEVQATEKITPWLLFELGPAMAFGDFDTQTEFAFRIWVGSSFW
jgi:hypothetical protein